MFLSFAVCPQRADAQWQVNGAIVCNATGSQFIPVAVSDGAGGEIVAWYDYRGGQTADIYAQHLLWNGVIDPVWTAANGNANGTLLCGAANNQIYAQIVSDGAGGAIVTWQDYRTGTSYNIYAQHVLASGVLDPAWVAASGNPNGTLVCFAPDDQINPQIITDGAGGAIISWMDQRSGNNEDLYAQHVLGTGIVDPSWTLNGVLLCNDPYDQTYPVMAVDGAGGAVIAWQDGRNSFVPRVYAQHLRGTGVLDPIWTAANGNANGTPVCTTASFQQWVQIVSDGVGGAIICWMDNRNGPSNDIYSQHVLGTGKVDPGWTTNGIVVCDAANDQSNEVMLSDGAGGAIISWLDDRAGSGAQDVYANHVLATGTVDPIWTALNGNANGTLLCNAVYFQSGLQIVSDGASGAIVAWDDTRSGPYSAIDTDVYAQHLKWTGVVDPAWTAADGGDPNGAAVCTATDYQEVRGIVSDGAGGAIVTWMDNRSGTNYDVYAQRIYGTGGVAAVAPQAVEKFAVRSLRPNPARAGATITFELPTAERVSASVYDVSGQLVRTIAAKRDFGAGDHDLVWDGASDSGVPVSPGIYFVRVLAGNNSVARRIAVVR
jgi:FlgD Ig-like domain